MIPYVRVPNSSRFPPRLCRLRRRLAVGTGGAPESLAAGYATEHRTDERRPRSVIGLVMPTFLHPRPSTASAALGESRSRNGAAGCGQRYPPLAGGVVSLCGTPRVQDRYFDQLYRLDLNQVLADLRALAGARDAGPLLLSAAGKSRPPRVVSSPPRHVVQA